MFSRPITAYANNMDNSVKVRLHFAVAAVELLTMRVKRKNLREKQDGHNWAARGLSAYVHGSMRS